MIDKYAQQPHDVGADGHQHRTTEPQRPLAPAVGRHLRPARPLRTAENETFERWLLHTESLPALPRLPDVYDSAIPPARLAGQRDPRALSAPGFRAYLPPPRTRADTPRHLAPAPAPLGTGTLAAHRAAEQSWEVEWRSRHTAPIVPIPAGYQTYGAAPASMTEAAAVRLATRDHRLFAAIAACAIFLLLAALASVAWAQSGGSLPAFGGSASGAANQNTIVSQPQAPVIATATLAPTPAPTAIPPTPAPTPQPTKPASTSPQPKSASGGIAPTVSALTLACGSPGVGLPLRNTSNTVQSWTLPLPLGVIGNGWTGTLSGTVNPGQTLTLYLWQSGTGKSGTVTAYVRTGATQYPVQLIFGRC